MGSQTETSPAASQIRATKTVLLTTFKRDGSAVGTPVSIAFDGDRAFFRTWHTAAKAKRLARNPKVEVAPSTLRGKPTGPSLSAHATLLQGQQRAPQRVRSHAAIRFCSACSSPRSTG